MKRSPLRRRKGLDRKGPSLAAVRSELERRTPLESGPRKTRARLSDAVIVEVRRLSHGRCVRCGTKRGLQRHHVLPVQTWPEHEREPRNMVLVCVGCHDEHERAHRRLRLVELPEAVALWAYTRGGRESLFMERTYPGTSGPLAGGSGF